MKPGLVRPRTNPTFCYIAATEGVVTEALASGTLVFWLGTDVPFGFNFLSENKQAFLEDWQRFLHRSNRNND